MRHRYAQNWRPPNSVGAVRTPVRCTATHALGVAHQGGVQTMATAEDRKAARDAKLDELHEKLTDAVEQLVSGEDWKRALTFATHFRNRSFNNTLLIWAQHQAAFERGLVPEPRPSYVAGYRQWQDLNRQVQKGQPGYQILAPVTGRFASATPANADTWRRLKKFEKPRPGEVVRSKMIGVRPAYVWDASQTAGDPLPELPVVELLEGEAPAGLWAGLATQIEAAGFALGEAPNATSIHGANGVTNYTERTVLVRADMDDAARVKTLAHELGHVLMHDPESTDVGLHRGISEVEAESVALMIGAAHGMDTSSYTIPYVTSWAAQADGKEPAEIVKATGERVRATALKVLDQLDTTQLGDSTPRGLERDAAKRAGADRTITARENVSAVRVATATTAPPRRESMLADHRRLA